ncbi:hypothetical protein [Variovorax sp. DXTD-1]|uniref:hypothetical protein n=1 Tax=Variovorax sp. DXTD-1 TaxID=2495592 RepID=UPI000F890942|nr:hypothetical protein [Variovorax sp. DXTD-1]RST54124.1 hypothetical protein EJI00_03080 [Variovorax sp. DXTD-1]
MLPKTQIPWRRRSKAAADCAFAAFATEAAEALLIADARIHALEAWAWGRRGNAPQNLQRWLDARITAIEAEQGA